MNRTRSLSLAALALVAMSGCKTIDKYLTMRSYKKTGLEANVGTRAQCIKAKFNVEIHGDLDLADAAIICSDLAVIPIIDRIPIAIVSDTEQLRKKYSVAGWYHGGNNTCVILTHPLVQGMITHELAHRRTDILEDLLLPEWKKLNTHPYGIGVVEEENGAVFWEDGNCSSARNGFPNAYGATNYLEDIAELTELICCKKIDSALPADADTRVVLLEKTKVLHKYRFISSEQRDYALDTLAHSATLDAQLPKLVELGRYVLEHPEDVPKDIKTPDELQMIEFIQQIHAGKHPDAKNLAQAQLWVYHIDKQTTDSKPGEKK